MSKNKKRAPKIGTVMLFLVFLAVFAVSAAKVVPYFLESREAESSYDELRGSFTLKPTKTPEPVKTKAPVTATPEPAVTAVPATATPEPVVTAVPVTATPEPTVTAVPATATPEPVVTAVHSTATPIPAAEVTVTAAPETAETPAQAVEASGAVILETAPIATPDVTAEPAATPEAASALTETPVAAAETVAAPVILEETPAPTAEPVLTPAPTRAPKAFHIVARPERTSKPRVQRIAMDFEELQKKGKRIVAWISCEGTAIDYPVVHGWNNQYYLDHLWNGEQNTHGSIFMDYMNSGKCDERNIVLYGHHMKDGSMFAALDKYKDQSFFEEHPTMTLYTPYGDYIVEIMSGTIEDGNYAFVRFTFQNDEAFVDYASQLKRRSVFKSDVQAGPDDKLLTLCTCSYEESNARFMVTGRLVPIYE